MGKIGKHGRKHATDVKTKSLSNAYTRNDKKFSWSLERVFWAHDGWRHCRSLHEFAENIIAKLQNFETQTWQEILNASGGKSEGHGNNNHFISADKLPRAERQDFIRCGYMEDYEQVFSLRLSAMERLIGIVDMRRFYILWYVAAHEFF